MHFVGSTAGAAGVVPFAGRPAARALLMTEFGPIRSVALNSTGLSLV